MHEADLPTPKDSVSALWTINDDFHLCLWNLVVLTFYAQLRVAVGPTDEVNRSFLASRLTAIEGDCVPRPTIGRRVARDLEKNEVPR